MEINTSKLLLNNINMEIERHKIVALIGASGAGKSLLARSLIGLIPKNLHIVSGEIFYAGQPITINKIRNFRGGKIFYTPQNATASINPMIKIKNQIYENSRINLSKLENILRDLEISDPSKILNSYAFELSEGENQRCLLAMAMAINPEFLILDEPTASLDLSSQQNFMALLKKIQAQYHMTLLVISHNLYMLKKISDFIYIMKNGIIIDKGTKSSIFSSPSHKYTKEIAHFF